VLITRQLSVGEGEFIEKNCTCSPKALTVLKVKMETPLCPHLAAVSRTLSRHSAILRVLAAMEREKGKKGPLALASERRAA
jgi:hypothetical protein